MTDRELLEAAARAAGIKFSCFDATRQALKVSGSVTSRWNPLTNDGDALRLGAAIEMELEINKGHVYCRANRGCREGFSEFDKEDTLRAMRRAIVRAAAQIGQQEGE